MSCVAWRVLSRHVLGFAAVATFALLTTPTVSHPMSKSRGRESGFLSWLGKSTTETCR